MIVRFVDIFVTTYRTLLVADFMMNSLKHQHWRAFQRYFALRAAPVLMFASSSSLYAAYTPLFNNSSKRTCSVPD